MYRYRCCVEMSKYGTNTCQCCGSESEIIRMFWLDPNPKKKFGFGYGFGFRHCCRMKIFVKNQTLEREKSNVFY
jgi:hypothetical protein